MRARPSFAAPVQNRGLTEEQFIREADFARPGVVRFARLQGRGCAYTEP